MRSFFLKSLIIILCCPFFLFSQISQAQSNNPVQEKPLRIAVAANFSPVLKQLLKRFKQDTGIETQVISAATGTLYQQIVHGAPFDLFLSADASRPERLEAQNLIIQNSRKTYVFGQLALWSANKKLTDLSALSSKLQRLAIANPDTAPYGKAAKQTLIHLSLWPSLSKRLITGININQTFQQVRSQAAPLGIVALSQLRFNNLNGVLIPQEYYQPIAQQLVIIKSSKQIQNAKRLSDFLLSEKTQQRLIELGYISHNAFNSEALH